MIDKGDLRIFAEHRSKDGRMLKRWELDVTCTEFVFECKVPTSVSVIHLIAVHENEHLVKEVPVPAMMTGETLTVSYALFLT